MHAQMYVYMCLSAYLSMYVCICNNDNNTHYVYIYIYIYVYIHMHVHVIGRVATGVFHVPAIQVREGTRRELQRSRSSPPRHN